MFLFPITDGRERLWLVKSICTRIRSLVNHCFTVKMPPKEGSLLFFPAWMEHSVEQNLSDEERISIAYNVALMNNPMRRQ